MKKLLFTAAIIVAGLASSTQAKAETAPIASESSSKVITTTNKMSADDGCYIVRVYYYLGRLYRVWVCI